MTKTPEEMAEEYAENWHKNCDYPAEILRNTKKATETVFLAGYKAGQEHPFQFQTKMWVDPIGPQDRWISVKERLPEEGVGWTMVYGCILSRWSVQPGFYDRESKEWVSRFINGYMDDEGYAPFESVTHWMPLPEPPEEEK